MYHQEAVVSLRLVNIEHSFLIYVSFCIRTLPIDVMLNHGTMYQNTLVDGGY